MVETIVGLYDDVVDAHSAVRDLVDRGFDRDRIVWMAYDPGGAYAQQVDVDLQDKEQSGGAALGSKVGAAIGGVAGLLAGFAGLTIAGLGPVVVAGPLAASLLGVGAGATLGGVVGFLSEQGIPDEEADLYAEALRRGGALVLVRAAEDRVQAAKEILQAHHPVDVEERALGWRTRGWEGLHTEAEAYTPEQIRAEKNFYRYEPKFLKHHKDRYATTGYPYPRYEPAYRYGYDLVTRRGYGEGTWEDVEPEARHQWEKEHEEAWEEVRDAVRHAWQELRKRQ